MAKLKNVLLLFGLFVSFAAGILPAIEADIKSLSGGVGVIDLEYYYSPAKALSMLQSYGPEGIHLYIIAQWTADLIFPLIAGFFFANLMIYSGSKRWFFLGFLVTLVDWIENVFITVLLVKFPIFNETVAIASCAFTVAKWTLLYVCISISIWGLLQKWVFKPAGLFTAKSESL